MPRNSSDRYLWVDDDEGGLVELDMSIERGNV